jgi:CHAD domain-containing protein
MASSSAFPVLAAAIGDQLDVASRAASDPGPDGIHDLRVSTRRLRAALDLWRECAPGKRLDRCRKRLKRLGRRLGSVREADVNIERLADLALGRPSDAIAIEFLADSVTRERRRRARRLRQEQERSDLPGLSEEIRSELGKCLDSEPEPVSIAAVARRELARRLPALEALLEAALREPSAPALHRLRIELKKFRYSVELCASAYDGRRLPPLVGRLKALQDALGAAQDVRALHDVFAKGRRELREEGLAHAERSLLSPMRAVAAILRNRQEAARRGLESSRHESFLSWFEAVLTGEAGFRPGRFSSRSYTGGHAASPRP